MRKLPKKLGTCADRLYAIKQELQSLRKSIQPKVEKLEEERKALEEKIINELPKSQAEGISGKTARVEIVQKDIPTVRDVEKLQAHVKRTGNFDLLSRAINRKAVEERWAENKTVPGVEPFTVTTVSLRKKR